MTYLLNNKKIWVAGHTGLVGSAVLRRLERENCSIITATRSELNLMRQYDVEHWMDGNNPDCIIIAAAKVGGIQANINQPAEFIYNNISIQNNIIHGAYKCGVEKLIFLGSSCIYPKDAKQPIKEEYLLSGHLEPSNDAYAIAKISGIKMCQAYRAQYGCDFISLMPTNLYGPHDNYDLESSHVIAALIRRLHEAKAQQLDSVSIWGSGKPMREFMHVDDLADACIFTLQNYSSGDVINIGTSEEISIWDLAHKISNIVGYQGQITNDVSKPDGVMRKLLDCSKIRELGWTHSYNLDQGLKNAYESFCVSLDDMGNYAR